MIINSNITDYVDYMITLIVIRVYPLISLKSVLKNSNITDYADYMITLIVIRVYP